MSSCRAGLIILLSFVQVGNWLMWFTESLGKESSHLSEDHGSEIKDDEEQTTHAKTKCFRLLNELSELLMLPKDMLMDPSIRKEVKLETFHYVGQEQDTKGHRPPIFFVLHHKIRILLPHFCRFVHQWILQ